MIAMAALVATAPAVAQTFPGEAVAGYYNEEMSTPRGWKLNYEGLKDGNQVFVMDRDFDVFADNPGMGTMSRMMKPIDQVKRMCSDPDIAAMINGSVKWRIDSRDKDNGKVTRTKGPVLERC